MSTGVCVKACPSANEAEKVECLATSAMLKEGSGCGDCVCGYIEEEGADAIPFRYNTMHAPLESWPNGFCIPTVSGADDKFKVVLESIQDAWKGSAS